MLPRASSTPISNSWLPHSKDCSSSPEPDFPVLQRTRSLSFYPVSSINDLQQKLTQTLVEINIQNDTPKPRKKGKKIFPAPHSLDKQAKQESDQEKESEPNFCSIQGLFTSSGLGEQTVDDEDSKDSDVIQILAMGGGAGNDGGKICGGAGGGGVSDGEDDDGGSGFFETNNHGSYSTDVYYQKMIEANPGNSLLLGNYAKFLKECLRLQVCRLIARAHTHTNPNDGNVLSLSADLIRRNQKDAHRAKSFLDQAVKTAPDDCFVLASYAKFLWDAEDVEDKEDEHDENGQETEHSHIPRPDFYFLPPQHPSITAAS